jgi:hypothetical protein
MTDGLIEDLGIVRIAYRLHRKDAGMGAKRLHRPRKDGFTADGPILLGSAGPGPQASAGGDDNGGSPF